MFHKMNIIGAAASITVLAGAAAADDLLIVDLTIPNQITITATDGLSAVTTVGSDTTGVYFDSFYNTAGPGPTDVLVFGDLTNAENPSDGSPALFRATDDPGLNLWSWSSDTDVSFTAGSLAFVGSATWDISATDYADMLAGNTSGDLYFPADTIDDLSTAEVLGTYSVIVPAPGALAVAGLGLGMGALRRRR